MTEVLAYNTEETRDNNKLIFRSIKITEEDRGGRAADMSIVTKAEKIIKLTSDILDKISEVQNSEKSNFSGDPLSLSNHNLTGLMNSLNDYVDQLNEMTNRPLQKFYPAINGDLYNKTLSITTVANLELDKEQVCNYERFMLNQLAAEIGARPIC